MQNELSGQFGNRRHVDATPVSAHTPRRETTYGGFVGSRYQTSTAPHVHDKHHAVLTHARPAHTMPATLLSSSSQTHAMLCRVRQQNPASGVSGRHAVGGRGAVVLRSATFTRPRGNARRVVVPHAQARGEPPRAVKQDAAIADIAPKQLPVEQRKVRISRSRNRRGDADGCAARSVLRFGDRGDYSGHESNEIRAARAEGTVAPAGTARAPARGCRLSTPGIREYIPFPARTTRRAFIARRSQRPLGKSPTDLFVHPTRSHHDHPSVILLPDPRGSGVEVRGRCG